MNQEILLQLPPRNRGKIDLRLPLVFGLLVATSSALMACISDESSQENSSDNETTTSSASTTENPRPTLEYGPSNGFCEAPDLPSQDGMFVENDPLLEGYISILEYPSMQEVKNTLSVMRLERGDGTWMSGYQVVLSLLQSGYSKNLSVDELKNVIEVFFLDYNLNNKKQNIDHAGIRQYILWVVQSLWVEKNNTVPWSLKDYTEDEINGLFYEPYYHGIHCIPKYPQVDKIYEGASYWGWIGSSMPEDITYQLYPLAKNLLGEETNRSHFITKSIKFFQGGFFHSYADYPDGNGNYSEDWDFDVYYHEEDNAQTSIAPATLATYFQERVSYCHEPVFTLKGLYRALNIPAVSINYNDHGMLALPTELRFVHGDNLVMKNMVPAEDILIPPEDFKGDPNDQYLTNRLYDKFGKYTHPFLLGLPIHRKPTGDEIYMNLLLLNIGADYQQRLHSFSSAELTTITTVLKRDFPQYHLAFDPATYQFSATSTPIRTLSDFNVPGKDPWQ